MTDLMQTQLLLPIIHPRLYDGELFFSAANHDVLLWFQNYDTWPMPQVIILGEEKSGKTTWLSMVQKKYGALLLNAEKDTLPPVSELPLVDIVIDQIENAPHEWLFHLINHQISHKKRITVASAHPLSAWRFETQDLASRMRAFYPLCIQSLSPYDGELFIQKLFDDRGISFDPAVIPYFLNRIERSYGAYVSLSERLDHFLLCKQKSLSLTQARDFFAA